MSTYRITRKVGNQYENAVHEEIDGVRSPMFFPTMLDAKAEFAEILDGPGGYDDPLRIEQLGDRGWVAVAEEVCDKCRSYGPQADCLCYREVL